MTIQSKIHNFTRIKGKITAYIDYFDDEKPDVILIRKCYEAPSIEQIKLKIETEESKLQVIEDSENIVKDEFEKFINERNSNRKGDNEK